MTKTDEKIERELEKQDELDKKQKLKFLRIANARGYNIKQALHDLDEDEEVEDDEDYEDEDEEEFEHQSIMRKIINSGRCGWQHMVRGLPKESLYMDICFPHRWIDK